MKKTTWIGYAIALVALFIGAFYDYQITSYLYHPSSWIALFFERFVLIPVQLMVTITMIMQYRIRKKMLFIALAFASAFYMVYDFLHYWHFHNCLNLLLSLLLSGIIIFFIYMIIKSISMQVIMKRQYFFLFFTAVLLTGMLLTSIIKTGWGRIRFRDMEDVKQFCVWYQPCLKNGNHSFPSGHTAAFSAIICFLQWKDDPHQCVPIYRYIVVIALLLIMPLTRMMMGAHFLSDTAMGFLITYSCYLVYYKKFHRGGRV